MGRKAGAKQVSEEGKTMKLDLYAVGVKQKDICEYYGMPKSRACNIVRRGRMNTTEGNNENMVVSQSSQNDLFYHCCFTLKPNDSSLDTLFWQNRIGSHQYQSF